MVQLFVSGYSAESSWDYDYHFCRFGLTSKCGYHDPLNFGVFLSSGRTVNASDCILNVTATTKRAVSDVGDDTALVEELGDFENSPVADPEPLPDLPEVPVVDSGQNTMSTCFDDENLPAELNLACGYDPSSRDFGYCRGGRCACPPGFTTRYTPSGAKCRGALLSPLPTSASDLLSPDEYAEVRFHVCTFLLSGECGLTNLFPSSMAS
jgi:hypothetical protein